MSEIRNKEREEEHKFILDFWSFRKNFMFLKTTMNTGKVCAMMQII